MCRIPAVHIRIHVRLLGPCFKTGRKSTSSGAQQFPLAYRKTFPAGQLYHISRSIIPAHLRLQRSTLQNQHTGNLTIKPISCSQSLPRTKSRHQLRLAIMLPHRLTPSSRTLPDPFSRIFRSHNTLSSSFHSFFKVLLSFPSQYFFAIGFPVIFRLWWILSPIQSILPNKFTLFPEQFFSLNPTVTRLSLSLAGLSRPFPPDLAVESSRSRLHHDTRTQVPRNPSVTEYRLYQLGLFLFHSPLLQKSLLFSFPSLIDMLKLRESSYRLQIKVKIFG